MEIPEELYEWLRATAVYELKPYTEAQGALTAELVSSLGQGNGFKLLLNYVYTSLNKRVATDTQINELQPTRSVVRKLHNWKIVNSALKGLGVALEAETVNQLAAGELGLLVKALEALRLAEKPHRATGLLLDEIDSQKALGGSKNCLEFLIISCCRNFGLTPKQGAGLLTANYKYLTQIIVKGLRGDYAPVSQ